MTQGYRTESDSMGEVQVPEDALYAAQTQRAVDNFAISGLTMPTDMIQAIARVKAAAAKANTKVGSLEEKQRDAIVKAAEQIINGEHHAISLSTFFKRARAPALI